MPEKDKKINFLASRRNSMIIVFLAGLFVGIGGFYLFYSFGSNQELNIFGKNDLSQKDSLELIDTATYITEYNDTSEMLFIDTIPDSLAYQQIWNALITEPGYREMDSLFLDSVVKKIYADSVTYINSINEGLNLQNEQLLSAKYSNVYSYTTAIDSDSVGFIDNGIHRYYFEFWSSPIHFSGYSKNGKSLKLYSVQPGEILLFILLDNALYMKRAEQWYLVEDSKADHPFLLVSSVDLCKKLNELKK